MRKKAIVLGTCVILFVGALSARMGHYRAGSDVDVSDKEERAYDYYNTASPEEWDVEEPKSSTKVKEPQQQYIEVDTEPDSYTVLVNREYPISKDYVPADLVVPNVAFSFYGTYEKSYVRKQAARALEKLFAGAQEEGYMLKAVSAYRSYERQTQIYNNNVNTKGTNKTNKVSAKPGSSEHQTGLAIDVSCNSVGCALELSFGQTSEGKWLKKNCHKYCFIIRYQKNEKKITGYSYEPWHLRYVGKNLAKYLKKNKMTLEEYYKLTTVENQVQKDTVDTDTDWADEPQMTAAPTPKPTIVPTKKPSYTKPPAAAKKPENVKPAAVKTPKPTKTPTEAPTKEPKPAKTPKPTKKPAEVTQEPVKTPKPTKKPVVTEEPEPIVTEPPVDDQVPEELDEE